MQAGRSTTNSCWPSISFDSWHPKRMPWRPGDLPVRKGPACQVVVDRRHGDGVRRAARGHLARVLGAVACGPGAERRGEGVGLAGRRVTGSN